MTVASNSYADKVFAEHPIGLWSFDEPADYVSLVDESYRTINARPIRVNLIKNPSFYPGVSLGMTVSGLTMTPVAAAMEYGHTAIRLETTASSGYARLSYDIEVDEGHDYNFKVSLHPDQYPIMVGLRINWYSSTGTFISSSTEDWGYVYDNYTSNKIYVTGLAPQGAAYARPEVFNYSSTIGRRYTVAAAIFEKVELGYSSNPNYPYFYNYFDGNNMGFWNGAEYESTSTEWSYPSWVTSESIIKEFTEAEPKPIFKDSIINKLFLPDIPQGSTKTIDIDCIGKSFNIDSSNGSVSIGTYLYSQGKNITVTIGISYWDYDNPDPHILNRLTKKDFVTYNITTPDQWVHLSETFDISDYKYNEFSIYMSVTYNGETNGNYVLIHGISVGAGSEQFSATSLGQNVIHIQSDRENSGLPLIPLLPETPLDITGLVSNAYGLGNNDAYYLANIGKNQILCAKNSNLPMVYGASNSTKLIENQSQGYENPMPSLIVPGLSFLNKSGQFSDITFETWIKIQTIATEPTRILGPIRSDDGIYVYDSFLVLKVGQYSGSYYVGEWDRPMLLAIRQSLNNYSVVINGEEVISLPVVSSNLEFPEKIIGAYDQDWIGFYCNPSVPQLEVDCIGIYPYVVPTIVEKRRWVYGQGVDSPGNIVGSAIGSSVDIDYTVANYAKNYSYPGLGKFQQGINENLLIEDNAIALPNYELPEISFKSKSLSEWYSDVQNVDDTYGDAISLKPNSTWNDEEGYLLFSNMNFLSQDVKAFYGIFESSQNFLTKQTLFFIENELTGDSLEVSLQDTSIKYSLNTKTLSGSTNEDVLYFDSQHVPGDFLVAGINIDSFVSYFGGKSASFFGSKQNLKVYVGGSKDFTNTFFGKIYRVGFCTARNLQKIKDVFTSQGIAKGYNALDSMDEYIRDAQGFTTDNEITTWGSTADAGNSYFGNFDNAFDQVFDGGHTYSILVDTILQHVASYTLVPKTYLGTFGLDVAINGYWQDYIPLSYFAKQVKDGTIDSRTGNPNTYLDVDFIQFNISYPEIKKFINKKYDTSKSIVKTYVSFQYLQTNSSINISSFKTVEQVPQSGVIIPGSDWDAIQKTKYEVVNDTIIYPPDNIDFGMLALVVHVEVISNGYKKNPIKIRSLELSSQALNAFVPNAIGTKRGASIYPYRKAAEYYDYKGLNPFSIYKGNTPYLYLTSHSGLKLRDTENINIVRGFSIPINKTFADYYKVGAFQMALRFDGETFSDYVDNIFEIEAIGKESSEYIKFYIQRVDSVGKRARIYAIDANTGLTKTGVTFYINGNPTSQAVIDINSWVMLGVSFGSALDFSQNVGAIRITGGMLFNSVSHYQVTAADEASKTVYRKWSGILTVNDTIENWNYWFSGDPLADPAVDPSTWREVLYISSGSAALVDGKEVYKKYTGTDRLVIDYIADTGVEFRVKNYEYLFYDDVKWSSNIIRPV